MSSLADLTDHICDYKLSYSNEATVHFGDLQWCAPMVQQPSL